MMKLIILDRDGVINQDSTEYIKSPDEWIPLPGSLDAIARLSKAGFSIAVATNQSGIERGLYDEETLAKIHEKMLNSVENHGGKIDYIAYCPHHPKTGCVCRKPNEGLITRIGEYFSCSIKDIPFVGDKLTDIALAKKVNAKPILVKTGMNTDFNDPMLNDVVIFEDLAAAVNDILSE